MRRSLTTLGLALLTSVLLAGPTRAGTLDQALLHNSGDILAYLKEHKIRTVGVLPFQVQTGSRDAQASLAPLSLNLPRRLENSLIMTMEPDERRAVGIIRDATGTVAHLRGGSFRNTRSTFDKLFTQTYNLAWDGQRVHAQAFLTGTVTNSGSMRGETQIDVDLLTQTSWRDGKLTPDKTWSFKTRTDTMLVADLGYNFSLPRVAMKRGWAQKRDELAIDEVVREDEKGERPTAPGHSPDNVAGFAFELEYNGVRQTLTASAGKPGARQPEYRAPGAPAGGKIGMYLTRTDSGPDKFGVLVMVNGQSTFNFEEGDPLACRKWIYPSGSRGRRDDYLGFYTGTEGKNLLPFRGLSAEESEGMMEKLGARAGLIEIYVFASQDTKGKDDEVAVPPDKELTITTRGMGSKGNKLSLPELRKELLAANNVRERKRLTSSRSAGGLILHEMEAVEGGTFSTEALPNPVLMGHLTIRYFEKGGAPRGR